MEAIGEGYVRDSTLRAPLESVSSGYTAFREGDVVVAKITPCFENGKGALVEAMPTEVGFGTTELHVLRGRPDIDRRFLLFVTQSSEFRERGTAEMFGAGGQKRVPERFVEDFPLHYPTIAEQSRVVAFLDRKTAAIDTLIAKKERLIELLEEKRQALITQAVTKGLDPTVPMKESGVEWLGHIPAHWEVSKLKYLLRDRMAGPFGSSLTKDCYTTSGYRVYGQEQVIPDDFSIGDYYISREKFAEMRRFAVATGDVLVSCVGTFGKIAVVPPAIAPGIINPRLIKLTPDVRLVLPDYLGQLLRSEPIYRQMASVSRGGTMDIVNLGLLDELVLPRPHVLEQVRIGQFIGVVSRHADQLSDRLARSLESLGEYRQALISAAATGKIEVPTEEAA
ncbi:MAG: hypothetical protein KJZ57_00595 [Anaerolineales bacterium]|nr:hypothetical protein [Anaerolineales bacterium]